MTPTLRPDLPPENSFHLAEAFDIHPSAGDSQDTLDLALLSPSSSHDAAAGREAADVARAGLACQLLPLLDSATPEAVARVEERTPSVARYAVGMRSPRIRTALRSGDIAGWDLDRLCAVSASLGHRVEAILVPQGMKPVVTFEPA